MKFPALLSSLKPSTPTSLSTEIIAGATLAAIGIPEVIGYSTIAKMPVLAGVLTLIIPMVLFVIFGSSKHLVVAADSATAAILAAGLAGVAVAGTSNYVALAGLVAGMTGLILIVARILQLGFIASFLSRTLLVGFLIGVGISVAVSQLPAMLGLHVKASNTFVLLVDCATHLRAVSLPALVASVLTLAIVLIGRRWPKIPFAGVVLAGAIIASETVLRSMSSLAFVGSVTGGLPHLALPHVPRGDLGGLVALSLSLALVILAQSAATSRAYALRYDEPFDEERDLVGLGLANLGAMVSGTYVVNGSPTKTEIVDGVGARSQRAALVTAAISVVALFTIAGPLNHLPVAVLAAVVVTIALRLVKLRDLTAIFAQRRDEGVVAILTAASVLAFGVEIGILVSVVVCLINHVRRGYDPRNYVMETDTEGNWVASSVEAGTPIRPGLFLYRFEASLYYANVEKLTAEVTMLASKPGIREICIDASAIPDVDYSAGQELLSLAKDLGERGVSITITHCIDLVRDELRRYGVLDLPTVSIEEGTREVIDRFPQSSEA